MAEVQKGAPDGAPRDARTLDAAAVMREIRSQVRRQRPASPAADVPGGGAPSADVAEIRRRIREVSERWHVRELPFDSPTPIIGPLLAAIRSAVNSIAAKWHVRRILLQQNAYNLSVFQLLQSIALELEKLEKQAEVLHADLSRRLQQQEERQEQRLAELQAELQAAQAAWNEARVSWEDEQEAWRALESRSQLRESWEQAQDAWRERQEELARSRSVWEARQEEWNRAQEVRQEQLWRQQVAAWNGQLSLLLGSLRRAPALGESQRAPARSEAEPAPEPEQAWDYLAFNTAFTGTAEVIKGMYRQYVPLFAGRGAVLDVGCGQGYFLELLQETGIPGYGVDTEAEMVAVCRAKGLRAEQDEALSHLASLAPGALDGIFAGHLIEHLDAPSLQAFLASAYRSLEPGGVLVCETPNTSSLFVMANTYYRDPTHQQPVHPETYEFLARAHGFADVELRYSSPVPVDVSLPPLPTADGLEPALQRVLAEVANRFERVDQQLAGYQNVALVACKPADAAS